jgi:hypothetical protein
MRRRIVVLGIPSHIQMFVMEEVVDRKELKVREESRGELNE